MKGESNELSSKFSFIRVTGCPYSLHLFDFSKGKHTFLKLFSAILSVPQRKDQKASGCLPYPQRCFLPQPGSLWQWCPWWFAKTRQSKGIQRSKPLTLAEILGCIHQNPSSIMLVRKLRPREEEGQGWDHKPSYKQSLDQNSGLLASRKSRLKLSMKWQFSPFFLPALSLSLPRAWSWPSDIRHAWKSLLFTLVLML